MLYIDKEILEDLQKVKNMSELVSNLLRDYFGKGGTMQKEEIINLKGRKEIEVKILNSEILKLEEKLQEIEAREARIKAIFKDIPEGIIKDFHDFPEMTEDILQNRFREIYSNSGIDWHKILNAWREYHNGS